MSEEPVGKVYKVVVCNAKSENLQLGMQHSIVQYAGYDEDLNANFYLTDTSWYLEDSKLDTFLSILGAGQTLAILVPTDT